MLLQHALRPAGMRAARNRREASRGHYLPVEPLDASAPAFTASEKSTRFAVRRPSFTSSATSPLEHPLRVEVHQHRLELLIIEDALEDGFVVVDAAPNGLQEGRTNWRGLRGERTGNGRATRGGPGRPGGDETTGEAPGKSGGYRVRVRFMTCGEPCAGPSTPVPFAPSSRDSPANPCSGCATWWLPVQGKLNLLRS